jgi:hypothetical protein
MKLLIALLLWCLLFLLCWPLALLVIVLFPLVWLICLPFRIGFWVLEGALGLIKGILLLPGRLLGGGRGTGR